MEIKPFSNPKYSSRKECIKANVKQAMIKSIPSCSCNSVCEETVYLANEKWVNAASGSARWRLFLYNKENTVIIVEQFPDYLLEVYLGDFGGFIGLAMGASYLTVIELLVCLFLYLKDVRKKINE